MNLRRFLDAAYALLVDEYLRVGVPLMETIEKLRNMGQHREDEPEQRPVAKAASNDQAMAQLQAQMAAIGR